MGFGGEAGQDQHSAECAPADDMMATSDDCVPKFFQIEGFDENSWFEEQAERLRILNQQQSVELEKIRQSVLPTVVPLTVNAAAGVGGNKTDASDVFAAPLPPSDFESVDSFFSGATAR